MTQIQGRVRAAALPVEERRHAIIAAALPLFLEQGAAVTTREIAQAAGIAEGTIFRVFDDKTALLDAVIAAALDPAPTEAAIEEIDATLPFEERLVAAVEILRQRVLYVFNVFSAASGTTRGSSAAPGSAELPGLTAIFESEADHLSRAGRGGPGAARAHVRVRPPRVRHRFAAHVGSHRRRPARRHPAPVGRGAVVLIKLMREYLRRYRPWLILVVIFQTIQSVATLSLPSLNANIIDNGALKGDTSYIWKVGAVMLGVTLIQVCFAIAATFYGARSAMGFGRDVRRDLFHTVMGYSAREVGQFGAPSLITRITNDVTQVQVFVLMTLTLFVTAPIMIIGGVIFAVREDGPLSLILLVAVPILLLSVGQVALRMHPQFTKMQDRIDRVNQVLREQITGMRVVRAFVREPDEAQRFGTANGDLTETSLKTGRMMAVMFPAVLLTINISSVAAVYFGAERINSGQMQVGALVAFLSYLIQILMAVMMSTFVLMMGPRASVCAGRIQEVLRTSSSVVAPTDGVTELSGPVTLELRHAEFSFPGAEQPVLHDLNFRVDAGQTLAIIGSTGSGKTALLNLIARLFDATNGEVLIGGVDVRELDQRLMERLIGFVPQKPFLFSGTIASNVRFGNQDATDAEVWEALEVAQARDFVEAKPDQLESRIAQGGTNVSGGQRQRLAIARALAHKPAIYLFDDSFSALDLATDARLRAALLPVTRDAVTVVVAQRVSTIVRADQILVLEEGRIVGLGTHRELLDSCETYQEIVESQFVAEEVA